MILAALAAAAQLAAAAPAPARPARPNVVLLFSDALRADALGAYGQPAPLTPSLDRLARRSLVFERAYAQASWTRDSMASVLTGLYHWSDGVADFDDLLAQDFVTLPGVFRKAGYATGAFVANPSISAGAGFGAGFDDAPALYAPSFDTAAKTRAPTIVDAALSWISARKGRPFFVLLFLLDTHSPYECPEVAAGRVPRRLRGLRFPGGTGDPRASAARACYAESVTRADAAEARLLYGLETLGVSTSTIIVFSADHGEELYQRGRRGHGHTLFNEVLHVPLLVSAPGVAHRRIAQPVELRALFRTLPALAGLAPPRGDAQDLSGCGAGRCPPARPVISLLKLEGIRLEAAQDASRKVILDLSAGTRRFFALDAGGRETPLARPDDAARAILAALDAARAAAPAAPAAPARDKIRKALAAEGYEP